MLDDDVTELRIREPPEETWKPATLHDLVQMMSRKLKDYEEQKKPLIAGFHCRGLHKSSNEPWVINGPTALGTMMSISMDHDRQVGVQFHPYSQLAEDSYGAASLQHIISRCHRRMGHSADCA